ncbi:MAG: UbiA family prenyltransferase [Pseudobdellovibrionaceae bacterium]
MKHYLICDFDDSLIKTDSLHEQWLILLKENPFLFLISFFWLLKGRAFFKSQIAAKTKFNAEKMLYRPEVIEIIKKYRADQKGVVILASASPTPWIEAVANHLNLFDLTLGSAQNSNLKGHSKLKAIREKIGIGSFTYIGDCESDMPIWEQSSEIIAINPHRGLRAKIKKLNKPVTYIKDNKSPLKLLVKQLRPHQWVKNILVFLPAIAGHKIFESNTFVSALAAFGGFSLLASFVYVFNDLLDIPADRNHPTKKDRPFASGGLPVKWGVLLLPSILCGVFGFASLLPAAYLNWLATYFVLNLIYSFYIKQQVILDIIALSLMYTQRIFAGAEATNTPISEWLLSFSTLFFFSLACVKRYTEIGRSKNKITLDGRGYRQVDYSIVQSLGVGTGLLSILIVLLYLQSKEVRSLYSHPQYLWYLTPILLLWISRVWLLTNRDQIHDDPVVFAVKDRVSWICFFIISGIMAFSI